MTYNKYVDKTGEMLNDIAMNGFTDAECGSVTENGIWSGLILNYKAIIQEDDQGFFDYVIFDTEKEAQENFNRIEKEIIESERNQE